MHLFRFLVRFGMAVLLLAMVLRWESTAAGLSTAADEKNEPSIQQTG